MTVLLNTMSGDTMTSPARTLGIGTMTVYISVLTTYVVSIKSKLEDLPELAGQIEQELDMLELRILELENEMNSREQLMGVRH